MLNDIHAKLLKVYMDFFGVSSIEELEEILIEFYGLTLAAK